MNKMSIKKYIIVACAVVLLLFALLSRVGYLQSEWLFNEFTNLYEHSLIVRRATGEFKQAVLEMRLATRELLLAETEPEQGLIIQRMEAGERNARRQIEIIRTGYSGPVSDIDALEQSFENWVIARSYNTELALKGEVKEVKESVLADGKVGAIREEMLANIDRLDLYSRNKTDVNYKEALRLKEQTDKRFVALISITFLFALIVCVGILRIIGKPLEKISRAIQLFREGDYSARVEKGEENEFGVLADSFNQLAEEIEANLEQSERLAETNRVMLSVDESEGFFRLLLKILAEQTDSQIVAIYLLKEETNCLEHFLSRGLGESFKQTFDVTNLEGVLGPLALNKGLQHLKNLPRETGFEFYGVGGKYIPREMVLLPIYSGGDIQAVVVLASLIGYQDKTIALLKALLPTLDARIDGVLAYRKIQLVKEELERKNWSLDKQRMELAAQTSELSRQNTFLEEQKRELDKANHLKTEFLSNMSHELRTPLNSIIALTGVLKRRLEENLPPEEISYLEIIERNGKNLLLLINDILDLARLETGKAELNLLVFDFADLAYEIEDLLKPQAEMKGITLINRINRGEYFLYSDAEKCSHIMQNLVSNAVKFTEKGQVEFRCKLVGENIVIEVIDTGIGIKPENIENIFDEFRQVDGGTTRRHGGTGLGLAIAQKYATMLGGRIEVRSIYQEGSTFTLYLPIGESEPQENTEQQAIHKNESLEQKKQQFLFQKEKQKILLVEDNEVAIIQLQEMLREMGREVIIARDGREALQKVGESVPDAIILDLMMPELDGFAVLKALRESPLTENVPVLILTAKHITKEELSFLRKNHIYQLVQKGAVEYEKLREMISGMIE